MTSETAVAAVGPERTCVGCRAKASQSDLVRLAVADGSVVVDEAGRLGGRGAYLHRSRQCLELAVRRRAITRALRTDAPLSDLSGLFPA